jgi:hypothetical protein
MLVRNNPNLMEAMPKFWPLKDVPLSQAPKKSCNCGAKQNITTPDINKQTAENILNSLNDQDFLQIKSVLGLDQLCYYKRNTETNRLDQICL